MATNVPTIDLEALPIALLPVRLETRFRAGGSQLAIRIIPDAAYVDSHEPELTTEERTLGAAAVADLANTGVERQKAAWRGLARRFGPERAAWIVQALRSSSPPGAKTGTWTRAPRSTVLPDRWIVLGYRNGRRVFAQAGADIPPVGLATGPDPAATTRGADGIDDGMRWMVDFDRAVAVGMAIVVQLSDEAKSGLDELFVIGVNGNLGADGSRQRIQMLLDAHHYTHGLGFVLDDTPTNNTPDAPAGYTTEDSDFEESFAVELHDQLATAEGPRPAATVAAEALGIDPHTLANVRNSGRGAALEQARAAMNAALWPGTWGYFAAQLMGGHPFADPGAARRHFVGWVRACGEQSLIRIAAQPYGVIPTISLDHWQPLDPDEPAGLAALLRSGSGTLRGFWNDSLTNVPRVGAGTDPGKDLVAALAMQPVSLTFRTRSALGGEYVGALYRFMRQQLDATWRGKQSEIAHEALARLGFADWHPRLEAATHAVTPMPWEPRPVVQAGADPSMVKAYLQLLGDRTKSSWRRLRDESYDGFTLAAPEPLLSLLLRHSLLRAYVATAAALLNRPQPRDEELVEIDPDAYLDAGKPLPPTPWDLLDASYADEPPDGPGTVGRYLDRNDVSGSELAAARAGVATLATQPTRTLERLLGETLDLGSHRLDAWMTSFATRRLRYLRTTRGRTGTLIGGYGWVEGLKPDPTPADTTGYVHAPSLPHATAAAVLASGYLAHQSRGDAQALAVDLSSERVRGALWLLEDVGQGQPLEALLAYRFERALQERGAAAWIQRFRDRFPSKATGVARDGQPPPQKQANLLDGLALQRAWAGAGRSTSVFGNPPWPAADGKAADIAAALNLLDDAVDALSDAILAEGVYQLMRGNAPRAAATLDAMASGSSLPKELEVTATPRTGTAFTHRLLVLLNARVGQAPPSDAATRVRSLAEPVLNAFAATLIGDPRRIVARVDYLDPKAVAKPISRTIALADLTPPVSPLDLIYSDPGSGGPDSELEQRLLYFAQRTVPTDAPPGATVRASLERVSATTVGFAEALEVARAARELFVHARALEPRDLALPGAPPAATIAPNDVVLRADAVRTKLTATRSQLANAADAETLRTALLRAAAFGIQAAVPRSATGTDAAAVASLRQQATPILAEIDRRLSVAAARKPASSAPEAVRDDATMRIGDLLGTTFRVLTPLTLTTPPAGTDMLDLSFATSTQLQQGNPGAAVPWLQRLSRVREGAGRLNETLTYAELLGSARVRLSIGQLPRIPGDVWAGLPFTTKRPGGRISVAAHVPVQLDTTKPVAGLTVDEWAEVVPSPTETTAVAFDADAPGAAAPNAILIAVPPGDETRRWDLDTLAATVRQTLELARIRTVDRDALEGLGQFAPATYFAINLRGATVSTDFHAGQGNPLL